MKIKGGMPVKKLFILCLAILSLVVSANVFVVKFPDSVPLDTVGRLFVILTKNGAEEPRFQFGWGDAPSIFFATSVEGLGSDRTVVINTDVLGYPVEKLANLTPGFYYVQALFDFYKTFQRSDGAVVTIHKYFQFWEAPGNLYSNVVYSYIDPNKTSLRLSLNNQIPEEELPADTDLVKFVKIKSQILSEFWGDDMYLRVGIILPRDYHSSNELYPVRYNIGGFGTRYTRVLSLMKEGASFYKMWFEEDTPKFIYVQLDSEAPFGDCYWMNSENNGPYADALMKELIPYIEQHFRAIPEPWARLLDGGSTGGWVSLALQVFYPDFFGGCWSQIPDPVDFRSYQVVNIYEDKNAYFKDYGFYRAERPSKRDSKGDTVFTIRQENWMEYVMGPHGTSGGQWDSWQATFSPKGVDGLPLKIWDKVTGEINHKVAEAWKKFDIYLYLKNNWSKLADKLKGKIHILAGGRDSYFLENAVYTLKEFLDKTEPHYGGYVKIVPEVGHRRILTDKQVMLEMYQAIEEKLKSK